MTASPISRMGTSVGMAGGSLAERHDAHQHDLRKSGRTDGRDDFYHVKRAGV